HRLVFILSRRMSGFGKIAERFRSRSDGLFIAHRIRCRAIHKVCFGLILLKNSDFGPDRRTILPCSLIS
ncbi:MAG: hypothetical protein ACU0DI_05825, partial [Paracoccaceae bacterium]